MQFDAARQAVAQLLQRAHRQFGPGHRWALPVAEQLAWAVREQGDYAGAETLVRQALALATPQSDPVQVFRLRSVLANTLYEQGRFGQARDEFAAVVAAKARIAGYEITDSLADRYNLARAHYGLADYAVAAQTLSTLVPARDRHLGPRHDHTLKARSLWAHSEAELGPFVLAVAMQLLTQVLASIAEMQGWCQSFGGDNDLDPCQPSRRSNNRCLSLRPDCCAV